MRAPIIKMIRPDTDLGALMTRILVADDHELLRDTLVSYFEAEAAFEVDSVGDFAAAVAAVEKAGGKVTVVAPKQKAEKAAE